MPEILGGCNPEKIGAVKASMTRQAGSMRLCLFFRERLGRSLRETYIRIDGSFEREKAG